MFGPKRKVITVPDLMARRDGGPLITMLTCYDAAFATVIDECGIDAMLVGDSLGMVLQGHPTTIPVTLNDICYHTRSVARVSPRCVVISDMPFGTYQESPEQAYRNAAALLSAGAQMIKIEGGAWLAGTVEFLVERGIPVCGHIGLTPQSIHAFGRYRVQGRDLNSAERLISDARDLENAGASMLVAELIPSSLGKILTSSLAIPTIGIGAGPHMTGQVLVLHDMLGITPGKRPRFVKNFLEETGDIRGAVERYISEVQSGNFPAPEHGWEEPVSLDLISVS